MLCRKSNAKPVHTLSYDGIADSSGARPTLRCDEATLARKISPPAIVSQPDILSDSYQGITCIAASKWRRIFKSPCRCGRRRDRLMIDGRRRYFDCRYCCSRAQRSALSQQSACLPAVTRYLAEMLEDTSFACLGTAIAGSLARTDSSSHRPPEQDGGGSVSLL